MPVNGGIYEYIHGVVDMDAALRYWARLGFDPIAEGSLDASRAGVLYAHEAALNSVRLAHPGCLTSGCGYVRLQRWEVPRNRGLGAAATVVPGGRWMGLYTTDILRLRDAFLDGAAAGEIDATFSPIVRAALADPAPQVGFFEGFMGLREMFVRGPEFRQAFIQRSGFDRPGFGHFVAGTPLPNTEGTHGNIVQAGGVLATAFYKEAFGLTVAGAAHLGGDKPSTQKVLMIEAGQQFYNERLGSPGSPTGFLQAYAPLWAAPDLRDYSRPGSLGLCCYSYRSDDLDELAGTAGVPGVIEANEFGEPAFSIVAPDGISWALIGS